MRASGCMSLVKDDPIRYTQFIDRGCEVAPKCLECPLPLCRYDDKRWRSNWIRYAHVGKGHIGDNQ